MPFGSKNMYDGKNAVVTNQDNSNHNFHNQVRQLIPAEVRMISGCHSLETSVDVSNIYRIDGKGNLPSPEGRAGGACTTALLSILYDSNEKSEDENSNKSISFQQILLKLRQKLAQSGMTQIPQLTSSRPLDLEETAFSLTGSANRGTQRALLVGINYYGQIGQLSGCINDVLNVKKYICEHHGFLEKHVLLLIDDGHHHKPTRENIIRALCRLVEQSRVGDTVYFHYSGHGGLLDPDYVNLFKAGKLNKIYDETLYPVDHIKSGQIRDFSLFNQFVKPMTAGVTVTCVMDCCHSGSVLDLPYSYRPTANGTVRMRQSMDSLTNLAYLYILAGGTLPDLGFESVTGNLQNVTGETVENLHGLRVEELSSGVDDYMDGYNMNTDVVRDGGDVGEVDCGGNMNNGGDCGLQSTGYATGESNISGNDGYGFNDFTWQGVESNEFCKENYCGDDCGEIDCNDCGESDCNTNDVFEGILCCLQLFNS